MSLWFRFIWRGSWNTYLFAIFPGLQITFEKSFEVQSHCTEASAWIEKVEIHVVFFAFFFFFLVSCLSVNLLFLLSVCFRALFWLRWSFLLLFSFSNLVFLYELLLIFSNTSCSKFLNNLHNRCHRFLLFCSTKTLCLLSVDISWLLQRIKLGDCSLVDDLNSGTCVDYSSLRNLKLNFSWLSGNWILRHQHQVGCSCCSCSFSCLSRPICCWNFD